MDNFDKNDRPVQYYSDGRFSNDRQEYGYGEATARRKFPTWAKAIIIILLILVGIVIFTAGCSNMMDGIFSSGSSTEVYTNFGHDYIGVLYVQGEIDEYGNGSYNHQYILNAIDAMMEDDENKGLILYVNTPGGSVYASDQVYLKIKEYQETTERPVYSSMQSQATSGGYYISAPADKIFADRNCWTGSIGVTMGNFVDVSELLANLGIKTETITAGVNKAMGSATEPMTKEQREILQGLVDEAYEQFVGLVAEGRDMTVEQVKTLADGRLYTAQQAIDNGLVDKIGSVEDAISDMMSTYKIPNASVEHFQPEEDTSLASLFDIIAQQQGKTSITDAEAIEALLAMNGKFRVSYISNITK